MNFTETSMFHQFMNTVVNCESLEELKVLLASNDAKYIRQEMHKMKKEVYTKSCSPEKFFILEHCNEVLEQLDINNWGSEQPAFIIEFSTETEFLQHMANVLRSTRTPPVLDIMLHPVHPSDFFGVPIAKAEAQEINMNELFNQIFKS